MSSPFFELFFHQPCSPTLMVIQHSAAGDPVS